VSLYLSYSGYKAYVQCPLSYWYKYVGKVAPPTPDNKVNSLYGSAVGTIFEILYRDKLWKQPKNVLDALLDLIEPTIDQIMVAESRKGVYGWDLEDSNYASKEDVAQDVREGVINGLDTIKRNRFVGPFMEAEMVLDVDREGYKIAGRADFVIQRVEPFNDLVILDGKGSKHRGKYVDGTQLRWYAMLYKMRFGKAPDALGFVYWRFKNDKALDWEPFDVHGLDQLHENVIKTMDTMAEGNRVLGGDRPISGKGPYQTLPEKGLCRLCSHRIICPDHIPDKRDRVKLEFTEQGEDIGL
jgi:hypothetical protein